MEQILFMVTNDFIVSTFAGLSLHDLDNRSWERELNSSQDTVANMNTLVENNKLLTTQVRDMSAELQQLKSAVDAKDLTISQQASEIKRLEDVLSATIKTRSRKVNVELSRLMREIYPKLNDDEKFHTYEEFGSSHNKAVTEHIHNLLSNETTATDKEAIRLAIKSRFQTERKCALESDNASVLRRRVSRRHGKFNARKRCALQHGIHASLFSNLTADDMSDEQSVDGDKLKVKKPIWRTDDVEIKLKEIDNKLATNQRKLRKRKIVGSPSTRCRKRT